MVEGEDVTKKENENPGEISNKRIQKIAEKQKEFEYQETALAKVGLEEEKKSEKWAVVFRWIIATVVAVGLIGMAWYLLL